MAVGRTLITALGLRLSTTYKRTDDAGNVDGINDNLNRNFDDSLANGRGTGFADLQYYIRDTVNNTVKAYDLDNILTNKWGDVLDYDAVKAIIIHNRETAIGRFMHVTFKNEVYYIGPNGKRVLWEPVGAGLAAIVSSASQEEGLLTVQTDTNITFDLIIIGSSKEDTSSSSGA